MKLGKVAIAASTFTFATLLSFGWSEQQGGSLSVDSAQAARHVSYGKTGSTGAAAARTATYRGGGRYGRGPNNLGGLVGGDDSGTQSTGFGRASYGFTGATGTYRAGVATSPGWGWGGGPYYTSAGYYGPGYNYGGGPNNLGGLVGGDDSGTQARGFGRASYGLTGATGTYRVGYGAGVATSPGWGWGGGPYYTSAGYYGPGYNYGGGPNNRGGLVGGDDSGTSPRYARVPNYGPTNAYAFGGPVGWWGGVNSKEHAQYMKNLHDSGYDPKKDYNANGTIRTQ